MYKNKVIENFIANRDIIGGNTGVKPIKRWKQLFLFTVITLSFVPSDCMGTNIADYLFMKAEPTPCYVRTFTENGYSPQNYEGRDDIAWCGDIACKISHNGKKLIIEYLDEYGKPVEKKNKQFDQTIIKTMCYDCVYVVVNMLGDGEYSKFPFVGLYKVDLLEESCELIDTANYIDFDRNAGKAELKTATGLAGECEADGFVWEEKTIDL